MKPEQQRIAIAGACGWKPTGTHWGNGVPLFWKTGQDTTMLTKLPNYLNDLNAIHEAVNTLTLIQRAAYRKHLSRICARTKPDAGYGEKVAHAKCNEVAEAFLRTLNLWIDS